MLDLDHSEDATHGQQELAFYHHHDGRSCYLPRFIFEGLSGKRVTAVLRPGQRPTGQENAAIMQRVVRLIRKAWPETHIVRRGDAHFANPERMAFADTDPHLDFLFGLAGNQALTPLAQPLLDQARALHQTRCANARRFGEAEPGATRRYAAVESQAGSWPKAYRVVLKAEVTARLEPAPAGPTSGIPLPERQKPQCRRPSVRPNRLTLSQQDSD